VLDGAVVAEAMAAGPPSTAAWTTVATFLRTHEPDPTQQAWPVVDGNGRVDALLTSDAIRATDPNTWEHLPVSAIALPLDRVVQVHPNDALLPALQRVETSPGRQGLVIADDGTVLGTLDPSALHRTIGQRRAGITA
jgi:hypothetical protein